MDYIGRYEHDEFVKRMEEEHERQNKRIGILEDTMKQYVTLTISVERLATSIDQMVQEQKRQGEKLEELEKVPVKNWNTFKASILSAIGGAIGMAIIGVIAYAIINPF